MKQSPSRRALITGGASGFGLGTAKALLAQGAQVAIADIDSERLEKAARGLEDKNLLTLELDVTSKASVEAAVDACRASFGGLDTLVNSAGVIHFAPLEQITEKDWDRVIDVDLKGVFLCSQAAAPQKRPAGSNRQHRVGRFEDRMAANRPILRCEVCGRRPDKISCRRVGRGRGHRKLRLSSWGFDDQNGRGCFEMEDRDDRRDTGKDPGFHSRRDSSQTQSHRGGHRQRDHVLPFRFVGLSNRCRSRCRRRFPQHGVESRNG